METKRASIRRVEDMTAEVLVEFESAEDLAEPAKLAISVADLNPDPVRVKLRSEDVLYSLDYDFEEEE